MRAFRILNVIVFVFTLIFPNLGHRTLEFSTVQNPPRARLVARVEPSLMIPQDSSNPCRGKLPSWRFTVTLSETGGVGATVSDYRYQFYNFNESPVPPLLFGTLDFARDFQAQGGGTIGRIRPLETKRGDLCISFDPNSASTQKGFVGSVQFFGRDDNGLGFCTETNLITLLRPKSSEGADLSITTAASTGRVEAEFHLFAFPLPGETFLRTIQVTNSGPRTANNLVITDLIEAGATFRAIGSDRDDMTFSTPPVDLGGAIACSLPSLSANTSATIWLFLKNESIPPYMPTFPSSTNNASVSSSTPDFALDNNVAVEEIRGTPPFDDATRRSLSTTTTTSSTTTNLGTRISYTTKIVAGPLGVERYSLAHILPKGTSFGGLTTTDSQRAWVIYAPPIGGTGVVLFVLRLEPNAEVALTITLNVLSGSSVIVGDPSRNFLFTGETLTPETLSACIPLQRPGDIPSNDDGARLNGIVSISAGVDISLSWQVALPSSGDPTPSPRLGGGAFNSDTERLTRKFDSFGVEPQAEPCQLVGYKLYIGATPDVNTTEENVWKTLPAEVSTTGAPRAPNGSYYALRATYMCPDGTKRDSAPSNVVSSGVGAGPTISGVVRQGKNLLVTGSGFVSGSRIFRNDEPIKTIFDSSSEVLAKKAGKTTATGDRIQVHNPDGSLSNTVNYQP